MRTYTLTHLRDDVLLRELAALVAQDRLTTAALLAHVAEVDARRLYVPAGYPSMHAYCVGELKLSEGAALRRIQAARAARLFPVLFEALAEGQLHLTAVCLLAPYLTHENVGELMRAATHRRKFEIEQLLARRFPLPGMPAVVRAVPTAQPELEQEHVESGPAVGVCQLDSAPAGECDSEHALAHVVKEITKSDAIMSASSERYLIQLTVGRGTHDKLRYAQALLSHAVPSGDVAQVLDRALDVLITQLEKRKFGAVAESAAPSSRPRRGPRRRTTDALGPRAGSRYVPAHVRRAVWERDQGQCTFVSTSGHRCGARRFLEFDHVDPVALGGETSVDRMRLRCRAHNQYEAERAFGEGFMARKRREARLAAAEARARAADAESAAAVEAAAARAAAKETTRDVLAGLRALGCRAEEARRAAELTEALHGATLEERLREALRALGRKSIASTHPCPAPSPESSVRSAAGP